MVGHHRTVVCSPFLSASLLLAQLTMVKTRSKTRVAMKKSTATPKSKAIVRQLQEKSNVKKGIAVEQGKAEEVKKRIAGRQVDVDEGDKENEDKRIAEEKAAHVEREIWMTERMREMEVQLRMLEDVMEDNEGRYAGEMKYD